MQAMVKETAPSLFFYESEKVKYKGQYTSDSKEGLWTYFDEDGEEDKKECYLNNELVDMTNC